jgi:hypothetical protein
MKRYEYIRIQFDFGDLSELNRYSGDGWRLIQAGPVAGHIEIAQPSNRFLYWALLERPISGQY